MTAFGESGHCRELMPSQAAGGSRDLGVRTLESITLDKSPFEISVQLFTQVRVLNASFGEDLRAFRRP